MYPAASNWSSPDADSAWVVRTVSGQQSVCQTNGWNFLVDLQTELKAQLQATPAATWDGTTVDGSYIPVNDPSNSVNTGWDYALMQALYAVASSNGAPQDALASVQSDAAAQTISARTLATAIWVAEYNRGYTQSGQTVYGQGSVNEISIPQGTILPQFGVVPPVSTAGTVVGLDCHTVSGLAVSPQGNPISSVAVIGLLLAGLVAVVSLTSNLPKAPREVTRRARSR